MEEAIKTKMKKREKERDHFLFFNAPDDEVLDLQLKTPSGLKIYKIAVDYPQVVCDSKPSVKDVDFNCEFTVSEKIFLEKIIGNNTDIRIAILNANQTLSQYSLKGIGFHPFPYDEERLKKGETVDFFKIVKADNLERELYTYINLVEDTLKRTLKVSKTNLERAELFKEYLKEELEE